MITATALCGCFYVPWQYTYSIAAIMSQFTHVEDRLRATYTPIMTIGKLCNTLATVGYKTNIGVYFEVRLIQGITITSERTVTALNKIHC